MQKFEFQAIYEEAQFIVKSIIYALDQKPTFQNIAIYAHHPELIRMITLELKRQYKSHEEASVTTYTHNDSRTWTLSVLPLSHQKKIKADFTFIAALNEEDHSNECTELKVTMPQLHAAFNILIEDPNTVLTRSDHSKTPSRFLELANLLPINTSGLHHQYTDQISLTHIIPYIYTKQPEVPVPIPRPAFHLGNCKKQYWLSPTACELLIRDPYSYFLHYILKLRPQEAPSTPFSKKDFGILLHKILDDIIKNEKDKTYGTEEEYLALLMEYLEMYSSDLSALQKRIYSTRIKNFSKWLFEFEQTQNQTKTHSDCEVILSKKFDSGINLSARIDRIDHHNDNIVLYDYKTGNIPSMEDIKSGFSQQMVISAFLLHTTYCCLPSVKYIILSGKRETAKLQEINLDYAALFTQLENFLASYASMSTFVASNIDDIRLSDYEYVRRKTEWSK